MPRFIISVRELYDRDTCGRREGIDTGFGVPSQPAASGNAIMSGIAFADVNSEDREHQAVEGDGEESEAIRLEALGDNMHQAVEGSADNSDAIQLALRDVAYQV